MAKSAKQLKQEDTAYDGQNYETHLVGLWIHNEEPMYLTCRSFAKQARLETRGDNHTTKASSERAAMYILSGKLRGYFDDLRPELEGFWADLMGAALQSVDWVDIAKDLLESK